MTAYPAWTPASRPGIIPLHPLTFGTILGRSFAALRQNPRVLLGFALVVQTVSYLIVLLAVGGVAIAAFSRLDTIPQGTDEFDAVLAGSTALTIITGFVLGLAAAALGVIVQGIVVLEVAHAAVAEKLSLGALWVKLKPVVWRLLGYVLLLTTAVVLLVGVIALSIVGIWFAAPPLAVGLTVLVVLGAIPLTLWLNTKLLLAPSAIILEHATLLGAVGRAWTLVRGRFWAVLGVIVVINLIFGVVAQVVSIPFSLFGAGLSTIIAPTGDADVGSLIAVVGVSLIAQAATLVIQAVLIVVQSTASALLYIDCRMRREGLDLDLLDYVEKRDAGATALPDPYRENVGRTMMRPPLLPQGAYAQPPAYGQPPTYGPPPAYGQPPTYGPPPTYGQPPTYGPPTYGQPPAYAPAPHDAPPPVPAPGYAPSSSPAPQTETPPAPTPDDAGSDTAADATRWTAPGASAPERRESPWS